MLVLYYRSPSHEAMHTLSFCLLSLFSSVSL